LIQSTEQSRAGRWLRVIAATAVFPSAMSCLSTSGGTYREAELTGALSKASWVTALNDEVKGKAQIDALVASPRETLKVYCANGRPRRAWQMPVKAIVPRMPAGIPIDEASQMKGRVYEAFKSIVTARLFLDEPPVVAGDEAKEAKVPAGNKIVALTSPSRADAEKAFRNTRVNGSVMTLLLAFQGDDGLLLGALESPQYAIERGGSQIEDKWRLRASPERGDRGGGLMGVVWPARRFKGSAGEFVWPVHPAAILEASLLPAQFTMLIPPSVQSKYFGSVAPGRGFFVRDDGTFDLSDAVKNRQAIWNAYFTRAVGVDEAQTNDPDVVQFNLRFDMELFCAYARPVDDLLTK
jgi:hypothetical protein